MPVTRASYNDVIGQAAGCGRRIFRYPGVYPAPLTTRPSRPPRGPRWRRGPATRLARQPRVAQRW